MPSPRLNEVDPGANTFDSKQGPWLLLVIALLYQTCIFRVVGRLLKVRLNQMVLVAFCPVPLISDGRTGSDNRKVIARGEPLFPGRTTPAVPPPSTVPVELFLRTVIVAL